MTTGAFPFLFGLEAAAGIVLDGAGVGGIFCLFDCLVEDPGSEFVVALGLLVSFDPAAFRLRVEGVVVGGGSAMLLVGEEAFAEAGAVGAGKPGERVAWATWRAEDLVILGDMSVNVTMDLRMEYQRRIEFI